MRLFLLMIVAVACLTSTVMAQDNLIASADSHSGDTTITSVASDLSISKQDLSFLDHLGLSIRVPYTDPNIEFDGLVYNHTNDIVIKEFRGFDGLVVKHCVRQMRRYYEEGLQVLWDNSNLHPMELDHRIRQFRIEYNVNEVRWWERRWFDSFTKENGGAGIMRIYQGTNQEIIDLGPFVLSNSGKLAWSGWKAEVFDEYDSLIQLKQEKDGLAWQANPSAARVARDLSVGFSIPSGNMAEGDTWSLSGSIRFNVKARGANLTGNRSAIRGFLQFKGYTHKGGKQWLDAELRVTARPIDKDYGAEIVIGLLYF